MSLLLHFALICLFPSPFVADPAGTLDATSPLHNPPYRGGLNRDIGTWCPSPCRDHRFRHNHRTFPQSCGCICYPILQRLSLRRPLGLFAGSVEVCMENCLACESCRNRTQSHVWRIAPRAHVRHDRRYCKSSRYPQVRTVLPWVGCM